MGTPFDPKGMGFQYSRMEFWPMASISAGVVGDAEINGLPQQPSNFSASLGSAATWSYIWVTLAFVYLFGIYLGMIHITRRGDM